MRNIYTIRDKKAGIYLMPFCCHSDGEAARQIDHIVNSEEKNQIADYPEDYDLYKIGYFDDVETGSITAIEKPAFVVALATLKKGWIEKKVKKEE